MPQASRPAQVGPRPLTSDLLFLLLVTYDLSLYRSAPLPVLNRCSPLEVRCYARFSQAALSLLGEGGALRPLLAALDASRGIILGLSVLALGES